MRFYTTDTVTIATNSAIPRADTELSPEEFLRRPSNLLRWGTERKEGQDLATDRETENLSNSLFESWIRFERIIV